ncbi:MAG: hypothetical protein AAGH83_07290 [Pseudomonadota bacterium]
MTDQRDDKKDTVGSLDEADLDLLFSAARSAAPDPDAALLARIETDGLAEMPRARTARLGQEQSIASRLARIADRLVWPAGLSAAALVGLWVGVSVSPQVPLLAEGLIGTDLGFAVAGLFPSVDLVGGGY